MRLLLLLTILLLQPTLGRVWTNPKNGKKFEATHISNDGKRVTLLKDDRVITFEIKKLHVRDQDWLAKFHPPKKFKRKSKNSTETTEKAPIGAAFDTLDFGDSQEEVIEKLKKSKMVEQTIDDIFLARVGLNGSFRTTKTIGGLHCHLYFDWNSNGHLKEVTLRTKPQSRFSYDSHLRSNWGELIDLLKILHGNPLQTSPYPNDSELQDGLILGSHLWRTKDGHSVLLGTGQEGSKFSVVVRITSEKIRPVRTQ